jgi:hypothetical protein
MFLNPLDSPYFAAAIIACTIAGLCLLGDLIHRIRTGRWLTQADFNDFVDRRRVNKRARRQRAGRPE